MVIEQIVEIPADRWITLEVPREIPAGRVVLTFTPVPAAPFAADKAKSRAARQRLRAKQFISVIVRIQFPHRVPYKIAMLIPPVAF
jgi:hypothetical protein